MWPFSKGPQAAGAQETLRAAGYAGSFKGMRIIAYSPDDKAANAKLHATTNRTLQKAIMDGGLRDCIHITGKMNALADPFHRRLCAEVARQGKTRFKIVYDGSVGGPTQGRGAAARSARRWANAAWNDKLSAVRLIGDELVDLWAGPTRDAVQYTVFGGRYTQLQGEHRETDGAPSVAKPIWLIESEEVNGILTEWAETTLSKSRDINEGEFRDFFICTNGVAAHDMLATLSTGGPIRRSALLTSRLLDFDPGAGDILDGLGDLGLVKTDTAGIVAITSGGRQFIAKTA
ncbi:hypothetical protein SAMN05216360_102457 [Methylobacterium phyllostachyos]|uniref:Uncharacterized protein n=2 Tax=Methylobacterium phyllostachyos TaxID=582672 RepID=A0A1G9U9B1_9HYPH|nr:hypothetical protein SAMN05216360_102457 [Methylobacterium phyllostachyos]